MKNKFEWDLDAERDIWRAICSPNRWIVNGVITTHPKSLWYFIHLAWGAEFYFREHPDQVRWLTEEIHGPFLDWLQKHLLNWKQSCQRGGTDRYFIATILPRGFGKSVTTSKAAMIWSQLDEPNMSTLLASSTTELAMDILKAIRLVLAGEDKNAWFGWLYGNWRKGAKKWSDTSIEHSYRDANLSEGSFDITSTEVGMTGYHHRIHGWDDPIYKNKLREGREAYMKSVHNAVNASYNALQTNGLLMFTLTRYLDDDVAGRHFREEGIATWSGMDCPHLSMFDKIPFGKGNWHVYFLQTEDELTGEPVHPILWNKKDIEDAKRRDPEDFACQQQNNPGASERAPIIESQLPDLFIDYSDFQFEVPIEFVSVHIDTAFKTAKNIAKGDDNAIVPWFHDARRNGIIYLDTDNVMASNEWREETFNDNLIRILLSYRKRAIWLKCLTDEVEPGGKSGTYKNRILSLLYGSGVQLGPEQFKQLNRTSDKKARIRTGLGYWVEGYVRILLHKDRQGRWIVPPVIRKLFSQITRIDAVQNDDLADAATDVFTPGVWMRPIRQGTYRDEGDNPWAPGDEYLKSLSRKPTDEEVIRLIDESREIQRTFGPGRGFDEDLNYDPDLESAPHSPIL